VTTRSSREGCRPRQELLARIGEGHPQPRLAAGPGGRTAGDPQRAYPIIHASGISTAKTSTSRSITESILRAWRWSAHRLFTSPSVRVNEILIDGEPITNEAFVANYRDIVYRHGRRGRRPPVSLSSRHSTALAYASQYDAPVMSR
jgi:folylpolyglutamate synthase/dihydropteroate synthase